MAQGHSDSTFTNFFFLRNGKANLSQISCRASKEWGKENLFKRSRPHDQYGHNAHIWLKKQTLKTLLLWNQKADGLGTCNAASDIRVLPVLFKDAPGLTLTYFTARSNMVPYAIVWEKGKTMDFSETIVVYDIKVDRCSELNVYMKFYDYQRSRSFIDLGPNLSDLIFLNFFSWIATRPRRLKPNFM